MIDFLRLRQGQNPAVGGRHLLKESMFGGLRLNLLRCAVILLMELSFSWNLNAQILEDSDAQAQLKQWRDYYRHIAHAYEVHLDGHPQRTLEVSDTSVFHYANLGYPSKSHGALFVWSNRGRPEAIGAIWSALYGQPGTRSVFHEFQSLSLANLRATWQGQIVWSPRGPGVDFKAIPCADSPMQSAALRLAQMRRLVKEFTVYRTRGEEEQLRWTRQPIYRYAAYEGGILDGAIFAFFDDVWWDPEVLLLIEARSIAGEYDWQFAGARMTDRPARLEHDGVEVWSVPVVTSSVRQPAHTYYFFRAESLGFTAPTTP